MSNTVTLLQLKTQCRERADQVNSEFISDSELNSYINHSYAELYDLLVSRYEDYFTIETSATVASGDSSIPLPTDFYKLRGLDLALDSGGNNYTPVPRFNWNNRNIRNANVSRLLSGQFNVSYRITGSNIELVPTDSSQGSYRLYYVPIYTPLVADTDTAITAVSNQSWHEYIIVDVAIKMLDKEESSTAHLQKQKQALIDRIESASRNRDANQPETISDTTSLYYDPDSLFVR
jgi:hypothetical protein